MKKRGKRLRLDYHPIKPNIVPVIKHQIKQKWMYVSMKAKKKTALNILSAVKFKDKTINQLVDEYREAKIYSSGVVTKKIPSENLKKNLSIVRVRLQPINRDKIFSLKNRDIEVIDTIRVLKLNCLSYIQKVLKIEFSDKEKKSMVMITNTSKKYYEIRKEDQSLTFLQFLDKYNFWECFNGNELNFILKTKRLEYQWKYLKILTKIELASPDFSDQFTCSALISKFGDLQIVKVLITRNGLFEIKDLNGVKICETEARKIDSVTKKPFFYKGMKAEICLKGEYLIKEIPMFYIEVKDIRDFELTIRKNKLIGGLGRTVNDFTIKKKKRNKNVKRGLKFGQELIGMEFASRTQLTGKNDNKIQTFFVNGKLDKSHFEAFSKEGYPYIIEFRVGVKDITLKFDKDKLKSAKKTEAEGKKFSHEFLFNEILEWNLNDELSDFYYFNRGKMIGVSFRLNEEAGNQGDNLKHSTLTKFRENLNHFLDKCYVEWDPNVPYDESNNLMFNVKMRKEAYLLTFVHDSKEIILRDERTSTLHQYKLDMVSPLVYQEKSPKLLEFTNKLTNQKTELMFESIRHKLLAECAISRAKQKGCSSLNGVKRLERPIRIFVTSWNTGDKPLPSINDQPWLARCVDADVIGIGVQEAKVSVVQQVVEEYFQAHKINVVLVNMRSLWHMGIIVYVKKRWKPFVTNNTTGSKPTGIAGIGGNKGGITVSFKIHRTRFVFLNCHLAAGASQEKMKYRRANAFQILQSIRPYGSEIDMISGSDYFFWVGDFNFRTDAFYHDVVKWSDQAVEGKGSFKQILKFDQLKIEQKRNSSFSQVFEGDINFKPTYRRKRDTNKEYSNKKNQSPSYTDRILICHKPNLYFEIEHYCSVEKQLMSDHRPVVGVFNAQLVYTPIGFFDIENVENELFKLDCKYAELDLDINPYFAALADYVPKSKIGENCQLHLRFNFNHYVLNQEIISSGTHFPSYSDPNRNSYKFNYRDNDLPSLYLIYPEEKSYSYTSLSVQLAIKEKNTDQLINIGYTDLSLRELFPVEIDDYDDKKLTKRIKKVREKSLAIENYIRKKDGDNTIDLKGNVYFYSIRIGTIIFGAEVKKLTILDQANLRRGGGKNTTGSKFGSKFF